MPTPDGHDGYVTGHLTPPKAPHPTLWRVPGTIIQAHRGDVLVQYQHPTLGTTAAMFNRETGMRGGDTPGLHAQTFELV